MEKNKYYLSLPEAPSFNRFYSIVKDLSNITVSRALQYEMLKGLNIKGKLLDFGGGDKASYRDVLGNCDYKSVNIDPKICPSWLLAVGDKIPCDDNTFDSVLSLNTLEHIYDSNGVICDIYRVLKPKGELILTVPFLYPIHGHPDDFFRPTPSWILKTFFDAGFSSVKIVPLVWGPMTTAQTCTGIIGPGKIIRKKLAFLFDVVYHKINCRRKGQEAELSELLKLSPIFYVHAIK